MYLLGGTAFHSTIEKWEAERFQGRIMTLNQSFEFFREALDLGVAEARETEPDESRWFIAGQPRKGQPKNPRTEIDALDKPNGENVEWWQVAGPIMVRKYIEHALSEQSKAWHIWEMPDGAPAIEPEFTLTLGDHVVRGFIDQVREYDDGQLVVVDAKTGSRQEDNNMQLGVYRCMLRETFGVDVQWGQYYRAKDGDVTSMETLTQWSTPLLQAYFDRLARAIEHGVFLPNVNSRCRTCQVKEWCTATGGARASEVAHVGYPDLFAESNLYSVIQ